MNVSTEPMTGLTVRKMPEGGYVVTDGRDFFDNGRLTNFHFASTTIGESLEFVRSKICPQPIGEPSRPLKRPPKR
jgi:hypothetical protein